MMPILRKPRVLIVDNEELWRQDHRRNLEAWGCEVFVAQGERESLSADARALMRAHCCHLALVDLRLYDHLSRHDLSGLELATQLSPAAVVIVSSYGDKQIVRDALTERKVVDFVAKEDGPAALRSAVQRALASSPFCSAMLQITWPENLSPASIATTFFPDERAVPADEAEDLVGQLFSGSADVHLEYLSAASRLSLRPRSIVLKARIRDRLQPVVVKLGRAARIAQEYERYAEYIDGQLQPSCYAQMEEPVILWNLGGAVYSFLGAALRAMSPYTEYYAAADSAARAVQPLEHLFGETWESFFAARKPVHDCSLYEAYNRVWGADWHARMAAFANRQPTLDFSLPGLSLPNPVTWLESRVGMAGPGHPDASVVGDSFEAVTHGDLQGDNLFVDHHGLAWIIDYGRAGVGPVLQDFCELEADILTRLARVEGPGWHNFYDLLTLVLQPGGPQDTAPAWLDQAGPEVQKAYGVISRLRELAQALTGITDEREYLWGLLFNAAFRATLLPAANLEGQLRSLLLGGLAAARLDHPEDSDWPRAGWPVAAWQAHAAGPQQGVAAGVEQQEGCGLPFAGQSRRPAPASQ